MAHAERGSAVFWIVPAYWQTILLKQASQADLATVSLSGRMRMFGGKANNRSASQMLFESSYLSVIQPRNVLFLKPLPGSLQVCFRVNRRQLSLFHWEWIGMD